MLSHHHKTFAFALGLAVMALSLPSAFAQSRGGNGGPGGPGNSRTVETFYPGNDDCRPGAVACTPAKPKPPVDEHTRCANTVVNGQQADCRRDKQP